MTTYCNVAVRRIALAMGCHDFMKTDTANRMVEIMSSSPNWRQDVGERATAHALKGGLAVAAKAYEPHGHVAVIYPATCQFSDSWGKLVPLVANIGRENGIMRVSKAFPVAAGEPGYWLYEPV